LWQDKPGFREFEWLGFHLRICILGQFMVSSYVNPKMPPIIAT
jgi:hypothetical protein